VNKVQYLEALLLLGSFVMKNFFVPVHMMLKLVEHITLCFLSFLTTVTNIKMVRSHTVYSYFIACMHSLQVSDITLLLFLNFDIKLSCGNTFDVCNTVTTFKVLHC
jgi:hypothetical protein